MKKIIVATDYSATASNALKFGANIARIFNAELVLFNVYHLEIHVRNALVTPEAIDNMIENNESRLRVLADHTAQQYGIPVSWVSKTIDTVEALEDYVATRQTDLVVMGMDSNLTEYKLLGNTTTSAIRRLRCPVLVVPNDVVYKEIRKILYACEHTFLTQGNHLDLLKEFARQFKAEIQVLHIETKEPVSAAISEQITTIDNLMENVAHTYRFIANPSVGDGIIEGVKSWEADLLVMVPHKAGFWELLFKGSTTREITLKTRVPLLVLPNGNG